MGVTRTDSGPGALGHVERTFGRRFRATRRLKEANGVLTLLGHDLEAPGGEDAPVPDGAPTGAGAVVIKVVPAARLAPGERDRLEGTLRALDGPALPALAPPLALGEEGGTVYFVRRYVPGVTLARRLAAGRLDAPDALLVAGAIFDALAAAHAREVLHLDLKPGNVVLTLSPGGRPERAVVVDFGLARSGRLGDAWEGAGNGDADGAAQLAGLAPYVAPELAGLFRAPVDRRTDLYAAGIVLYECLAGGPPFTGQPGEVLRQHLSSAPPSLAGRELPAARALDGLVQRLLQKEPAARYPSAAAAGKDVAALRAAIARGESDPAPGSGATAALPVLTEPGFVGRAAELAALQAALDEAARRGGRLVCVEGESGAGKTRLLDELAGRQGASGAWVLRGQGVDASAQGPFQVLSGVVEGIAALTRATPPLGAALAGRIGEDLDTAATTLPGLTEALASSPPPAPAAADGNAGPEAFGEARALDALAALLDSLGTPDRAALVLLDDVQWADEATVRLLRRWRHGAGRASGAEGEAPAGDAPGGRVLVVVAFRGEAVGEGHPLRRLSPDAHLRLAAMEPGEVRRLAVSMAGDLPEPALALVQSLAAGSPFMAAAALRGLSEAGALVAGDGGWRVEPLALDEVRSSYAAATVLARRLDLLPAPTLGLLTAGAVLGRTFDLGLAARLAGESPEGAAEAVAEARRRHLLWSEAAGQRFVHDRLRETLLSRLEPPARRDLHRRAAAALAGGGSASPAALAYHLDAAGSPE